MLLALFWIVKGAGRQTSNQLTIAAEMLVYIDESGIDISLCKDKDWGKEGQVLLGKKSGKYYQRANIVARYANKKSIAPMVFNGSCATHYYSKLGWKNF